MTIEEVLRKIDELMAHHEAFSMFESTNYHKGAFDVLEELRDEIKRKENENEV